MNKVRYLTYSSIFAGLIFLATAYLMHIPTGVGYIHLGDTFIFLAACILPTKYAAAAALIGASLADISTGAMIWVIPTMIIKPIMAFMFVKKQDKIVTKRNILTAILSGLLGTIGYLIAEIILFGDPRVAIMSVPTGLIQPIGSIICFIIIGTAIDKNVKGVILR